MPDNPDKKGRDAKFVSKQPHEQAYQRKKAAKKRAASSSSAKKASAKKASPKKASSKSKK